MQTSIGISHELLVEVNLSSEMLFETIMSRGNMNTAYKRVMSNKGSGGVASVFVYGSIGNSREHTYAT